MRGEEKYNWRASVASETLTAVTQSKIGDVCLFVYLYIIWTYVQCVQLKE